MRLPIIDFLRGYSIFTIVLFHLLMGFPLPDVMQKAINFGGAGVHVFILVSGFGLCLSQMNKPLSYIQFIKRRLTKVYIPYIIVIAISALIPFMYGGDRLIAFLSHAFLFKMFDNSLMDSFGGQFWFVSTIIQLYILFPFVYRMLIKFNKMGVIIAFIISLLWAALVGIIGKADIRIWNSFCLQYLGEFVLGMMLAIKYKQNPDFIRLPKQWLLLIFAIVGIAIVGISGIKGGIFKLYNDIPSLVGYLSLALLIYSVSIKPLNNFFIYTNRFSYEWYLLHILVFSCVFHFFGKSIITGIIALAASYTLAIGYHKIIGKIQLGHRHLYRANG
jgi:peptidoglycan/LPS O-acetylase OafA/YrhL